MSRIDLWDRAAEAMREDDDPRWHTVADWLHQEAAVQDSMEPFVELVNMAIEKTGGPSSYLRFGRKPDGEITMFGDTNEPATAVALASGPPNTRSESQRRHSSLGGLMSCRYNKDTDDYHTPDGDPCRHDEYGDPTRHCTARRTCSQHIGPHDQTCNRCLSRARTNIRRLIELAPVYALLEDEDKRGDREAMSLAGPIAHFPTWEWRWWNRRYQTQDTYQDKSDLLKKHIDWLDAERDDHQHPTLLFARWVTDLPYTGKPPALDNVATLGDWLDTKLGKFAQDPTQEFGRFAAELRTCLNHVEHRLSLRGEHKTLGVSCPECAIEGHKARLVRLYAHWCEDPDCEKIHVADESADIWRCPRDHTHVWNPEQYRNYLEDRKGA